MVYGDAQIFPPTPKDGEVPSSFPVLKKVNCYFAQSMTLIIYPNHYL